MIDEVVAVPADEILETDTADDRTVEVHEETHSVTGTEDNVTGVMIADDECFQMIKNKVYHQITWLNSVACTKVLRQPLRSKSGSGPAEGRAANGSE